MAGKKSRSKGAAYEREIASVVGTERTARSGKADDNDADVLHPYFFIECKRRSKLPKTLMQWWNKTIDNAEKVSKIPLLFTREDYAETMVIMRLQDFNSLVKPLEVLACKKSCKESS